VTDDRWSARRACGTRIATGAHQPRVLTPTSHRIFHVELRLTPGAMMNVPIFSRAARPGPAECAGKPTSGLLPWMRLWKSGASPSSLAASGVAHGRLGIGAGYSAATGQASPAQLSSASMGVPIGMYVETPGPPKAKLPEIPSEANGARWCLQATQTDFAGAGCGVL
jgi:hypothetical protein